MPPGGPPPGQPYNPGGADNRKLFLILGLSSAAVLVVVLTLILALSGPTQYSALVRCGDADSEGLTLEGDAPSEVPSFFTDAFDDVDSAVLCGGEDDTGEIVVSAFLINPLAAEEDGAMESVLNSYFSDNLPSDGETQDIAHGDHSRAEDFAETGSGDSGATVGFTKGNILYMCAAEGGGEPEERVDRALQACSSYEDAMQADAPRA
ncbi:hypothetical protein [Nocardiopsis coralliicola]